MKLLRNQRVDVSKQWSLTDALRCVYKSQLIVTCLISRATNSRSADPSKSRRKIASCPHCSFLCVLIDPMHIYKVAPLLVQPSVSVCTVHWCRLLVWQTVKCWRKQFYLGQTTHLTHTLPTFVYSPTQYTADLIYVFFLPHHLFYGLTSGYQNKTVGVMDDVTVTKPYTEYITKLLKQLV